jgi:hypothetical protein
MLPDPAADYFLPHPYAAFHGHANVVHGNAVSGSFKLKMKRRSTVSILSAGALLALIVLGKHKPR